MKARRMKSKKRSTCVQCKQEILPGNDIYWARGVGAWHADCRTTNLVNDMCSSCGGSGARWNNAPCPQCDGTGSRKVQDFAKSGGHPQTDNSSAETCREYHDADRMPAALADSRAIGERTEKGREQNRIDRQRANSSAEDACCGDLAYEDDCARRCGL